jgi:hypothetical protein
MLALGIAVVLLLSTPTWFASDQAGVGAAQLFLAVVLAGIGTWFYRGSAAGPSRSRRGSRT